MSESSLRCQKCGCDIPPGQGERRCGQCGMLAPAAPEDEARAVIAPPTWDDGEDMGRWKRKKFTPRERLTAKAPDDFIAPDPAPGDKTTSIFFLHPFILALFSVCSLGLVGIVWTRRVLMTINNDVRAEERLRPTGLHIWFFGHALFMLTLAFALAFERQYMPVAAFFFFCLSFVMSRYYLFWIKSSLAEEAEKSMDEWLPTSGGGLRRAAIYRFSRSPLKLWFVGAAYMQFHISRMVRYGAITKWGSNPWEEPAKETEPSPEESDGGEATDDTAELPEEESPPEEPGTDSQSSCLPS